MVQPIDSGRMVCVVVFGGHIELSRAVFNTAVPVMQKSCSGGHMNEPPNKTCLLARLTPEATRQQIFSVLLIGPLQFPCCKFVSVLELYTEVVHRAGSSAHVDKIKQSERFLAQFCWALFSCF